jgi:hypothetical protein
MIRADHVKPGIESALPNTGSVLLTVDAAYKWPSFKQAPEFYD